MVERVFRPKVAGSNSNLVTLGESRRRLCYVLAIKSVILALHHITLDLLNQVA
jgi:hypothetical protein